VLLTNAGEATVSGVEIEGQWAATDDLQFSFNYTYLDPEIDRVDAPAGTIFDPAFNSASPYQVGDNIAEVFALPYTSENSYTVSADWTFAQFGASALSAHLNYRWEDDFFASSPTGPAVPNRELYQIDAHDSLDARLMWSFDISEGRQARVSVWGTNILTTRHRSTSSARARLFHWTPMEIRRRRGGHSGRLHALGLLLACGADVRRRPGVRVLTAGRSEDRRPRRKPRGAAPRRAAPQRGLWITSCLSGGHRPVDDWRRVLPPCWTR
jgi:hypothetical protein